MTLISLGTVQMNADVVGLTNQAIIFLGQDSLQSCCKKGNLRTI